MCRKPPDWALSFRENLPPPVTIVVEGFEEDLPYHIFSCRKQLQHFREKRFTREPTGVFVQMGYDAGVQTVLVPEFLIYLVPPVFRLIGSLRSYGMPRNRVGFFAVRLRCSSTQKCGKALLCWE